MINFTSCPLSWYRCARMGQISSLLKTLIDELWVVVEWLLGNVKKFQSSMLMTCDNIYQNEIKVFQIFKNLIFGKCENFYVQNVCFAVWTWKKNCAINFLKIYWNSLLYLFIYFFVIPNFVFSKVNNKYVIYGWGL